jgi:hypothetical protein
VKNLPAPSEQFRRCEQPASSSRPTGRSSHGETEFFQSENRRLLHLFAAHNSADIIPY